MPAQPVVGKRVRAIHAALIAAGWEGRKLPRETMEAYLARELDLSLPNIRVHIDLGRMLGLWSLVDRRPRPGLLLIHAAESPSEVVDRAAVVDAAEVSG